jgi:hypothetical protein
MTPSCLRATLTWKAYSKPFTAFEFTVHAYRIPFGRTPHSVYRCGVRLEGLGVEGE